MALSRIFIGDKTMALFTHVDRETLDFMYEPENQSTYIPFEKKSDTRVDGQGKRLREKKYIIAFGEERISVYEPFENENLYREVGYIEFQMEKEHGKKQMKIWYLTVQEAYEGLGLGSVLIAGAKHRCVMERVDTMVLDAARRYKPKDSTTEQKYPFLKGDDHIYYNANLALYQSRGFEIDKESSSYEEGMENNLRDSKPIPMILKVSNMVIPNSYLTQGQDSAVSHREQDGGRCQ